MKRSPVAGYSYEYASNVKMNILGNFLDSDVFYLLDNINGYQKWIKDDSLGYAVSGNITFLEKENDIITLSEIYSQEKNPTEVKLSRKQLIKLLDDWRDKVCKTMPPYIMIKYENNEYIIETSETPFD